MLFFKYGVNSKYGILFNIIYLFNTQMFRILIKTDAGAQMKTLWNVFDRIDEFHNCGRS